MKFYDPLVPDPNTENHECMENTSIFLYSNFQYVISVLVFSISKPFRKPFYTNLPLLVSLIIVIGLNTFIMFSPFNWLNSFLDIDEGVHTWF